MPQGSSAVRPTNGLYLLPLSKCVLIEHCVSLHCGFLPVCCLLLVICWMILYVLPIENPFVSLSEQSKEAFAT